MSVIKDSTDTSASLLTDSEIATYFHEECAFKSMEQKQRFINLVRRMANDAHVLMAETLFKKGKMTAARFSKLKAAANDKPVIDPKATEHIEDAKKACRFITLNSPLVRDEEAEKQLAKLRTKADASAARLAALLNK